MYNRYIHIHMNRMIFETLTDSDILLRLRQTGCLVSFSFCLLLGLFSESPRFYAELTKTKCLEKCSYFHMVPISILILSALFLNVILRYNSLKKSCVVYGLLDFVGVL